MMIEIVAKDVTRDRKLNPLSHSSVERQAVEHIQHYHSTLNMSVQRSIYRLTIQYEEDKLSLSRLEHVLSDLISNQKLITACANILRLRALQEIL